ncbi:MAG: arsenate reductase ArsC [Candidatus Cloacimonetes bacterium]|nr:arsenate reductase ArsC [Candidatus Cloacimonadota bacterium]
MLKILILCTGNSCRSVMAEGLLNHYGNGLVQAFSAGSFPVGKVHPESLATLNRHGLPDSGYRSKSWDEFLDQKIDIVITVCDNAAGETCPLFVGSPIKAHWGVPDPAHFEGSPAEIEAEFDRVFLMLKKRVDAFLSLPIKQMSLTEIHQKLKEIGNSL